MSVVELLNNRHTIRNYDPKYEIPKEILQKIIEVARIAPTAYTVQDVDFIVCTNRDKNQEACEEQLKCFPQEIATNLNSRKEKFGVSNVITCDASAEIILYHNERGHTNNTPIHAGLAGMSICACAREFGLDTMCHAAMCGPGAEKVYGIPQGSSILAVALGRALPNAHISERQYNNKVTYLD
ncbi:nitroreductase family protein [Tritrichomonas foetus]|uniref:Nitroreductase family protein n=1 Tax=Tritrichomonas foetus TaxID=1144522 RepID=A0A1J4KUU0_9EUKA|nr:nitroreductase family protein [Tritrichomonas foetus]OHT14633.1 nitroreductase family protein [Tritrichomonas foetus]|eukprot:OHT14632.1 nitroreductase family protein [Tritrichomonas foetus]